MPCAMQQQNPKRNVNEKKRLRRLGFEKEKEMKNKIKT